MDWKIISFKFPRELTKEEENCFIASFQALVRKVLDVLSKAQRSVKMNPLAVTNKAQRDMIVGGYQYLIENIYDILILEANPTDKKEYFFKIAYKNFEKMEIKIWKLEVSYWKRLQNIMVDRVRKEVCRKISMKPDKVIITFYEMKE